MAYEYSVGEVLVDAKDLHVAYDGVEILRGVNVQIKNLVRADKTQGQVDALLAPSGMGKTQFFRCVAGLNKPTSGEVFVHDRATKVPTDTPFMTPVRVGMVGVVAQDYPLFNHLTVIDNLMVAAQIRQKDAVKAKENCLAYLERFGLVDRQHFYPHQLSGGQRQRVAIIQQMVSCGHLLLMDEPFSGLDINVKEEVQHLIADVASEDDLNSVIITTHDIQSAIAVADTILLLGRERDKAGAIIPGAFIKYSYNLINMGLAWHPEVEQLPQFAELEKEIRARFKEL